MKRALVSGITGQDGSFLAELLLSKGYEVHGIIRRASSFNTQRLDAVYGHERLHLHYGDMLDQPSLLRAVEKSCPDEVYNLAGQSHVAVSFEQPEYTHATVAIGALSLLESVRLWAGRNSTVRFYQAGSSEMFGNMPAPQNEMTRFNPQSPYAVAKAAAHYHVCNYRDRGLFACNGILFNHESPRRGETFVTRKITRAVGRIKYGLQDKLVLGNIASLRDWGYAPDYAQAMWLMLQQSQPDDYVIGTGKSMRVSEFALKCFIAANAKMEGHLEIAPRYIRPLEVYELRADASKAADKLGWKPTLQVDDLIKVMTEYDLRLAEKEAHFAAAHSGT